MTSVLKPPLVLPSALLSILVMPPLYLLAGLGGAYATYPLMAILLVLGLTRFVPDVKPEPRKTAGSVRALLKDRDFWLLFMGFAFIGMLAGRNFGKLLVRQPAIVLQR